MYCVCVCVCVCACVGVVMRATQRMCRNKGQDTHICEDRTFVRTGQAYL